MNPHPPKPSVLLVDDEPRIIDSLRDLLDDDFEVRSTTNPHDALEMLRTVQFAVIVADQRMPELTGDRFLTLAQEISDATRILITGYTDIQALMRAVNDGQIFTYLPKPWEPGELKGTVFKAAKHSEQLVNRKMAAQRLAQQQEALARSEANLRHQSKLLQSILDSMGDGVLVANADGHLILTNPAAEQLLGHNVITTAHREWTQENGISRPVADTHGPAIELPLLQTLRGEAADGIELFIRNQRKPEGMFLSVNVRPLKDDDGQRHGGVAVVRDITTAKESEELLLRAKEEAERANRAKSDFLSRMSHELRTPLNSILGFAQLLQLASLTPDDQDNVHQILKGGYHLLDLINEVLDLAKIEAGKLTMSPESVPLGEVLKEALDIIKPVAQQQGIRLNPISQVHGLYVHADRQRLKQVILNLLANGIKFNREGGSVSISCLACEGERVRVAVSDSGRGMSDEALQKVFTPFERFGMDEAGIDGTGLGLALSKRLIEAMGGSIGVQSVLGEGSTFTVELDRLPDPSIPCETGLHLRETGAGGAVSLLRGTVLYIEDNLPNLRLMERIASRHPGVNLLTAVEGRLGLELARAHQPDWILLDVHLPDLTGDEVLRQLQGDPATQHIPVTVVSADATTTRVSRLLQAGAREYVTKPLDVKQILSLMEGTMHKSMRPTDEARHS